MMKKYCFLTLVLLLFTSFVTNAQNKIFGKVTNVNGEPEIGVNIILLSDNFNSTLGTTTSTFGDYSLDVGNRNTVTIRFSSIGFETVDKVVSFFDSNNQRLDVILKEKTFDEYSVEITAEKDPKYGGVTKIDPKLADKIPLGGIEKLAVLTGMGVRSNNELSSQYTVRGGNFDENLVYVNDFEIYRQFLVRSGEQEGLSFINPDMVASVDFSTGGFEAKYGDKLSSVLDVKYKRPTKFAGSVSGSLLGFSSHFEGSKGRFRYILGYRQKSNKYLLNALPAQGQYQPLFRDFQGYFTYLISQNFELQYISNFSQNRFRFFPEYEERNFGSVVDAQRLSIFFEGGENDTYTSSMNGLGLNYTSDDGKLNMKIQSAFYRTAETEAYDIIGQYFIGQVESNLGDNSFGDVIQSYGIGTYHNWARNRLDATLFNTVYRGYLDNDNHFISWGLRYQREAIEDKLMEWNRVDSAGYSLPYAINDVPYIETEVSLQEVLQSEQNINSNRISGFVQDSWTFGEEENFNITAGARFNYWNVNEEFFVTPRVQFYYKPKRTFFADSTNVEAFEKWKYKRDSTNVSYRFSLGTYYQPPFYRELRNQEGIVNKNVNSQKSLHTVFGVDYNFYLWKRPFKFTTELYYKHLWDLVPYDFENVLIRYYGDNLASGYAVGADFRVFGQFVKGVDSWFTLSLLQTKEKLSNDSFIMYVDSTGTEIFNPIANADLVVDSMLVDPGFVRRPTDQRFAFSVFFQDYLPNNDRFKMSVNLVYGAPLPFSPPNNLRYRNVFSSPPYTRVDIGFSALLFNERIKDGDMSDKKLLSKFSEIWASIEVFNLLANSNVVAYSWVSDFAGKTYAIPNRLTARRLNARVVFRF